MSKFVINVNMDGIVSDKISVDYDGLLKFAKLVRFGSGELNCEYNFINITKQDNERYIIDIDKFLAVRLRLSMPIESVVKFFVHGTADRLESTSNYQDAYKLVDTFAAQNEAKVTTIFKGREV